MGGCEGVPGSVAQRMTEPVAVAFRVVGLPIPQGSLRAYRNANDGPVRLAYSNASTLAVWRGMVAAAARDAWGESEPPTRQPVGVQINFGLPRPASHYGTGRNADRVRLSAPLLPATRPDLDKLTRAVLDALTGTILVDDAQVCLLDVRKVYAELEPGAIVKVAL